MKKLFIYILFLFSVPAIAQEKSIDSIQEVYLVSAFSPEYQVGYQVAVIGDSILKKAPLNLTNLLRKQANVYIKEYGNGMTASISMRGSSASHTAVYWNGIPLNSSLNGQTDFNTFIPALFDKLTIRKGGGSVLLGSGAIGGAINMENIFTYKDTTKGNIKLGMGSYYTKSFSANARHTYNNLALQIGYTKLKSDNDYPYLNTDLVNENGEIINNSLVFGLGVKINEKHRIYTQGISTFSDRNTSGTLYMTSNANLSYKTRTFLSGWKYKNKNYKIHLKSAYSKEQYQYLYDKSYPDGVSENSSYKWIHSLDYHQQINDKIKVFSGVSYEALNGEGMAIDTTQQQKLALFSLLHHKVTDKLRYNASIRKEWSDAYKIPIVFSVDSRLNWNKQHSTLFNFSTNFRAPTLNDLYWNPGGNPDLKPEESWTAELGQQWKYKTLLELSLNAYRTENTNLIQWQPVDGMIWKPFNIQKVNTNGLEFNLKLNKTIGDVMFSAHPQYSYTISKDKLTKKELIYRPIHMGNSNFAVGYKRFNLSYDINYTGKVFTTTSNTDFIDSNWVSNSQFSIDLYQQQLALTMGVNNIYNKAYEVFRTRPMPNRNYTLSINYSF